MGDCLGPLGVQRVQRVHVEFSRGRSALGAAVRAGSFVDGVHRVHAVHTAPGVHRVHAVHTAPGVHAEVARVLRLGAVLAAALVVLLLLLYALHPHELQVAQHLGLRNVDGLVEHGIHLVQSQVRLHELDRRVERLSRKQLHDRLSGDTVPCSRSHRSGRLAGILGGLDVLPFRFLRTGTEENARHLLEQCARVVVIPGICGGDGDRTPRRPPSAPRTGGWFVNTQDRTGQDKTG